MGEFFIQSLYFVIELLGLLDVVILVFLYVEALVHRLDCTSRTSGRATEGATGPTTRVKVGAGW